MNSQYSDKYRVLCLVSYYLPGYKAGGPLRTISNMVDHLSEDFEFWIITRDRDLGDMAPYQNVAINQWVKQGNAKVMYLSPDRLSLSALKNVLNEIPHELLYLNSFFDPVFTLKPIFARAVGMLINKPVVLAPRGEFSGGALKLKALKKRVYIGLSKITGLFKEICWQASSVHEKQDIVAALGGKKNIVVALDLPVKIPARVDSTIGMNCAEPNILRIVFLSRISPMKNLSYALKILSSVQAKVEFDVYGPLEDKAYWRSCQRLLKALPANILCRYLGEVEPNKVAHIFSQYDLFLFPTQGENYGHVIAESLSVGTVVLISDKTPWHHLKEDGLGEEISLRKPDEFVCYIQQLASTSVQERNKMRELVKENASRRLIDPAVIDANRNLFLSVIERAGRNQLVE